MSASCVHSACPKLLTSLEEAVNNLQQACWYYQTCKFKVVPTSPIQSWYNNTATTLCRQPCNILVISWLYQTYSNNLATSLIMLSSLLPICVNSLFQTCYNNWEQTMRTQLVDSFVTTCVFTCVPKTLLKNIFVCLLLFFRHLRKSSSPLQMIWTCISFTMFHTTLPKLNNMYPILFTTMHQRD
jgi:hypothetical protein